MASSSVSTSRSRSRRESCWHALWTVRRSTRAGGSSSRTSCVPTSPKSAPPSRIPRGSSTGSEPSRVPRWPYSSGSHHVPTGRRGASACGRASTNSMCRQSRESPAGVDTARRQASRAKLRGRTSRSSCGGSLPPRALKPAGVVLVDKPAGPSSFAIVAKLRHRTGARTGHAGTLDPFATGLLLLLSGSATKLAPCFVGLDKRYVTDVDLTARTSPGDPEGEVIERTEAPSSDVLAARLAPLRGDVDLPIPAASAVKMGGERAYRLARRGITVEMPVRRSRVYALDVIAYDNGVVSLDLR